MLHRDDRKSKEAVYQREWNLKNPEYKAVYQREWNQKNPEKAKQRFVDGEEKTDAVRQDESFENRMGEILYVADASKMITCAPVTMGKVKDTKFVQNNQGAIKPQYKETDQDSEIDPLREQRRFYWKDRPDFQTKPEYEEWAKVVKQLEEKMGSVIKTARNGASEFLRLQVASLKCSICNSVLTLMCCFRGPSSHWLDKGHIVTICSCNNSAKEMSLLYCKAIRSMAPALAHGKYAPWSAKLEFLFHLVARLCLLLPSAPLAMLV